MAHQNPTAFNSMSAVMIFAIFLLPFCDVFLGGDDSLRPPGNIEVVQLQTDGLPTPLSIVGDPLNRLITSVDIRGEILGAEGEGTFTFDESKISFDEFGDVTTAPPKVSKSMQVTFKSRKQSDKKEKRRLYEIVFADGSFVDRMQLVLSDGTVETHSLVIRGGEQPNIDKQSDGVHLVQVLDLHGLPEIKQLLPDAPFRTKLNLTTLSSPQNPKERGLQRLSLRGALTDTVYLDIDPNHLGFNAFGDVVFQTLIGNTAIAATLKRVDSPDHTMKGRTLYEIVTNGKEQSKYFLVLSQTEAGPHRMIIRKDGQIQNVLSMHDRERRDHLAMQAQLDEISVPEQQAVADLRKSIGYGFRIKIESQCVVELSVHSGDDADCIDPALRDLKNLRSLSLRGSRLRSTGLANVRCLTNLEKLQFSGAHIEDQGLASIKDLTQLRRLWFYECRGITDEGLIHLAGLKNLKWLRLSCEVAGSGQSSKSEFITDSGLEHLKEMSELESLDLMGQRITDVGLERVKGLTKIKELYLSGAGITDVGMEHLKGLSHLKYLHLYQTGVTSNGKAALKAKFPKLDIGD